MTRSSIFSRRMNTTQLGSEFEEEAILVESAARRKETNQLKQKSKEYEFKVREKIVQQYFLRMCTYKKKEFLVKLLENVRSADSIMHIMNFMPIGFPKLYNYSGSIANASLVYDTPAIDHDRMLEKHALKETISSDLEWFRALTDAHQVGFFIDLLRRGGGYLRRAITGPLTVIFYRHVRSNIQASRSDQEAKTKKVQIATVEELVDLIDKEDDEKQYDPAHPSSIEVQQKRKKWNDIIEKYRKEVEKEESKMKSKFGDGKGDADEAKKGKGGKADKSKASSKKGGKVEEEIDLIQTLPVWIGKKILNYLDQKTLKKMKAVNSYWAYIIQDLIVDTKTRKKLDKAIVKLKSQIDPERVEEAYAFLVSTDNTKGRRKTKRVRNINNCVAMMEEMVPRHISNQVQGSLITDVENEMYIQNECVSTRSKPFVTFPREIKDDKLYKHIPCFLRDVRVILGTQGGCDKNISFLTYSLSSRASSSMDFDVDLESLLNW